MIATPKLQQKIERLIEDNTNLVIENNDFREAVSEKEFEIRVLERDLKREQEITVVIRDCVLRFSTQNSVTDLINICAEYILHYYGPDIMSFYIKNETVFESDDSGGFHHLYDFYADDELEATHPDKFAGIFKQMMMSHQMSKELSSFDLKLLQEKKTMSSSIFKIQYSKKVIGFLVLEYTSETPPKNVDLLNLVLEIFASSYSTLILTQALAGNLGDAMNQAYQDWKTGIANTRRFTIDLGKIPDAPYCLVAIDIDDFKNVNDSYGHDMGDVVLRYIGQTLDRYMGELNGRGYREGGDEFFGVSLAPLTVTEKAVREMLDEIWNHQFQDMKGTTFTVSNSIGIYERKPGEKHEFVKKKVDILLYRSKETGKKRITIDQDVDIGSVTESI